METRKPRVLLIGEGVQDCSYLAKRLEERGCECSFAVSYQESCLLLRQQDFDLVLSPLRLRDGSGSSLIGQLEGSSTTLFYSCAVEQGCWWLPALRRGQRCFGSPALRSSEFVAALDKIIEKMRFETPVAVGSPSLLIPRSRNSAGSCHRRSQTGSHQAGAEA